MLGLGQRRPAGIMKPPLRGGWRLYSVRIHRCCTVGFVGAGSPVFRGRVRVAGQEGEGAMMADLQRHGGSRVHQSFVEREGSAGNEAIDLTLCEDAETREPSETESWAHPPSLQLGR